MSISRLAMLTLFTFLISLSALAQSGEHRWKPIEVNDNDKIWFDTASLDSAKGGKFDVWVLEMHRPPLRFEGIRGEVYRSKTLYTVNLENVKYGIMKVVYYNLENREIFNYDYGIGNIIENVKYTYPVMEDSFMHKIIREYVKSSDKM